MRLVKVGINPNNVIHMTKCYNCHSEYEFKLSDPEVHVSNDPRDGTSYSFKCQICNLPVYYYNPPKGR